MEVGVIGSDRVGVGVGVPVGVNDGDRIGVEV